MMKRTQRQGLSAMVAAVVLGVGAAWTTGVAQAEGPQSWPEFRGPTQLGDAGDANVPLTWSEDENVTWKTAISGRGWSTPIVDDGKVWLTTATDDGTEMFVYCVDAESGEVLLRERLFYNDDVEPLGNNVNGYASPTGAVADGRFYAHFGSYGTAAIDVDTLEVLWRQTELECRHFRGPGSSVVVVDDKLILTMDGIDQQYVAALDTATGELAWRTDRTTEWDDYNPDGTVIRDGDFRKGYGTPIVYEVNGQTQMLSVGAYAAFAYDPHTGEEIWKFRYDGFNAASRPVMAQGRVIINTSTPRATLIAIDPDGEGDITETNEVWRYDRGVPLKPSPVVVDDELIIFVDDGGVATCLDAATGEAHWRERVGGQHSASPIAANGRVYFFHEYGPTIVAKAAPEFEQLAENELDEGFMASPAVVGDTLFLRTRTHLYRIEE